MIALAVVPIVLIALGVFVWRLVAAQVRELRAEEFRAPVAVPVIPAHHWQPALPADVAMSATGDGVTLPETAPPVLRTVLQYTGSARDSVVAPRSTTINGAAVVAFDHVFRTGTGRSGAEHVEHDACVKFTIGVHCPLTIVTARSASNESGFDFGPGFTRVQLPSDDFNRTYDVATQDEQFALHLFDPAMIEWFVADLRLHTIVFSGPDVLVSFSAPGGRSASLTVNGVPVSRLDPDITEPDLALPFVTGFLERLSVVVTSEFGAPASS